MEQPVSAALPKVSVMLKAYNHERYLGRAIESALAQETSFPFEIVIAEDYSSDRTREIACAYAASHPAHIRLLLAPSNLGMARSTMAVYQACRGEYVAWLDGDDYWISRHKLQKQAEFLDQNRAYTSCFHDSVFVTSDDLTFSRGHLPAGFHTCGLGDILARRNKGIASTWMYRNGVIGAFPPWFASLSFTDFPFQVLHAEHGPAARLPGIMTAYRVHKSAARIALAIGSGTENSAQWFDHTIVPVYRVLDEHLGFRHTTLIETEILRGSSEASLIDRATPNWLRAVRTRLWSVCKRHPGLARLALRAAGIAASLALTTAAAAGHRSKRFGS
jgi:glycosyltransferase involved in cell wall biosynthesis